MKASVHYARATEEGLDFNCRFKTPVTQEEFKEHYREVCSLEVPTPTDEKPIGDILEEIFFNLQGEFMTRETRKKLQQVVGTESGVIHTSMMVGDIVVVPEGWYIVRGLGFEKISLKV